MTSRRADAMAHATCQHGDFSCATGIRTRYDLGAFLAARGYTAGVELGVQRGSYSQRVLSGWKGVERYVLVDLWRQQTNYVEAANVDDAAQEAIFQAAMHTTRRWRDAVQVCRNLTSACGAVLGRLI